MNLIKTAGLKHIEHLSRECPSRHTGEPDEKKAAEYIAENLEQIGLAVKLLRANVMGWEVTGEPKFTIVKPHKKTVEFAPFIHSGSTPKEGIRGVLHYFGKTLAGGFLSCDKYAIIDPVSEFPVGFIVGRLAGPTVGLPGPPSGIDDCAMTWPSCIVGEDTNNLIKGWIEKGKEVEVEYVCTTKFKPGSTAWNVQGILKGQVYPEEIIVICAHHDSQGAVGYPSVVNSPGASDNGVGCARVLELARYFRKKRSTRTLYFCTFYGEEWNLLGSKDYVRILEETGLLENVIACVNNDGGARRGYKGLFINTSSMNDGINPSINMMSIARKVLQESGVSNRIKVKLQWPPVVQDGLPFYMKRKPMFWQGTIDHPNNPYWHRNQDTYPEAVDSELFMTSFDIYKRVIDELQNIPTIERAKAQAIFQL